MTTQEVKRKLVAILSADVKGYSRLMGEDEEWTVHTLTAYKEVMGGLIQQHRGRVVGTAGDSVLAEFASVVDAVQCGVEIQQVLKAKNAMLPENRRMEFRIGINLGDVIEEGDTIYGDGVNIASRLEGLAEPGGICISESAYQQIENKLPLHYDYLGEHEVKNIAKPVRVYKAQIESEAAPSKLVKEKKPAQKRLPKAALAIAAIILIVGLVALYQFVLRPSPRKTDIASKEKMAFPLPDVPSIAVLPFVNMSKDPDQEFLCDGMTEEIITSLSKVPQLLVIARNSTFTYKGKSVKIKQVSEELGVRYVMEGSLQRSGDRIRINTQLIDALTGNHLWAERYDRDLKDIFALQDEIVVKILTAVQGKLALGGEAIKVEKYSEKYYKGKQGLDCYLKLVAAIPHFTRGNIEGTNQARRMIEEAIAMCPENPLGYMYLGWVELNDYNLGNTKSPRETVEKGIELAQKALAMDDSIAVAHALLGMLYLCKGEDDRSIVEAERAVALNPGGMTSLSSYGSCLSYAGRPEEAIPVFQKAIRTSPTAHYLYANLGMALRMTGRFEEAVSAYKKAIQLEPNDIRSHVGLTGTYSMMGREKEARAEAAEVLRINPKYSLENSQRKIMIMSEDLAKRDPDRAKRNRSKLDQYINYLRKAGLK